jgi:hypothetical protein
MYFFGHCESSAANMLRQGLDLRQSRTWAQQPLHGIGHVLNRRQDILLYTHRLWFYALDL